MADRPRLLLLALALMLPMVGQAADGQAVEPQLERRQIFTPAIDTEDFEIGGFVGLLSLEDFGVNPVYGATATYHINEDFFAELAYGVSKGGETSYETLSGSAQLLTDEERELNYYTLSVGYNLFPGEAFIGGYAFNTAFYLTAGAGSTEFAGDSAFTVSLGAGYRFLATDWLALRAEFRDLIFDTDLLGEEKTTHNLMFTLGASVFF